MTNSSFETNATGWSTIAGASLATVNSGSGIVAGDFCLEVGVTTSNQSGVQYTLSSLTASTTYTLSVYITGISGDLTAIGLREGDGAAGTRAMQTFSPNLTPGQTVRKSLTWTSSATPAGSIQIWRTGSASSSGIFRVDAVMLEQGSSATAYNG
ncbi:TPA: hypothetical protein DHU97_02695 [Candidatus Saccharibacteria bacterium]|nr:hypothetical protein [Candidatus Saccharibacteria bacterium]